MKNAAAACNRAWSIILAGGDGERIRPFVEKWLGYHRPKQYCTFAGTRSMFQHTVDRADMLTPSERRVTVIARDHREEACSQLRGRASGKLILQPANRGTAAGIFLPLSYVQASDPDGTVVVYPSDHFIYPEVRFMEFVLQATVAVETFPDRIILLGVRPDGPNLDYGWIEPGVPLKGSDGRLRAVVSFIEKPSLEEAGNAMARGALWNTFVTVGKVKKLWELGRRYFPDMMSLFEILGPAIGTHNELTCLETIYTLMPERNFCMDLLALIPDEVSVLEIADVIWSDWGRFERIAKSLLTIGRPPAFPEQYLKAS
jgi:mannose-1-phosphate guanylyltransferase